MRAALICAAFGPGWKIDVEARHRRFRVLSRSAAATMLCGLTRAAVRRRHGVRLMLDAPTPHATPATTPSDARPSPIRPPTIRRPPPAATPARLRGFHLAATVTATMPMPSGKGWLRASHAFTISVVCRRW